MAAIKGGKLRKEQPFHSHKPVRDLRTEGVPKKKERTFSQQHQKRKHKKSALHRHAVRREVQRMLRTDDATTDVSMGALLQAAAVSREVFQAGRSVIRTARKTRSAIKAVRHYKKLHPGEKLVQISLKKRQFKILGKHSMKRLLKGSARSGLGFSRDVGSYTKDAMVQALDSNSTTNSTAGGIHMSVRAVEVTAEAIRTGKAVHRTVKRVRNFRQGSKQRRMKKKAAKAAAAKLRGGASRSAGKALGAAVKNVVMRQPVLMGGLLIGLGLFALLMSITGASSLAMINTNMILMDNETAAKYQEEMQLMEADFEQRIQEYRALPGYGDIRVDYMCESGELKPNWSELLAIIAVEFEQNLSFSQQEQQRMGELFDLMNVICTRTEKFRCSGCCSCGENPLHCHGEHIRLIVEVYVYGMDDIPLDLDEDEMEWARHLATSDLSELFPGMDMSHESVPPEILGDLIANAPTSSATREQIRETALSLVGRVKYFWGGKSTAGWNSRWGKPVQVTAPGNSTTGTYQPYGLDCSGFTDWVYKTAGVGNVLSGGSSHQWNASYAISEQQLLPGDLVFKQPPGRGVNHVGIYVGRDSSGKKLYCHCAWSQGVTVDSYKGFKYYRRPLVKFE